MSIRNSDYTRENEYLQHAKMILRNKITLYNTQKYFAQEKSLYTTRKNDFAQEKRLSTTRKSDSTQEK